MSPLWTGEDRLGLGERLAQYKLLQLAYRAGYQDITSMKCMMSVLLTAAGSSSTTALVLMNFKWKAMQRHSGMRCECTELSQSIP